VQEKPIHEIPIIIVGNKVDLVRQTKVPIEEGEKLAAQYGVPFLATSAKTRQNVDEVFITLVKEANRCRANSPIYSVIQMISHKQPISEIKRQMAKCSQLYRYSFDPTQICRDLQIYSFYSYLEVAISRGSRETWTSGMCIDAFGTWGSDPSITNANGSSVEVEIKKYMPDLLPFATKGIDVASLQLLCLKTVLANLWMWDMGHLQQTNVEEDDHDRNNKSRNKTKNKNKNKAKGNGNGEKDKDKKCFNE
jgi:hypothetical protein